jgi:hypothetical protein
MGVGDVGGDVLKAADHVVKISITEAADIGADVGMVARRAVNGVIEATKEIGGNVGGATQAAVEGALDAAGTIGHTAVKTIEEMLIGIVEGGKHLLSAALPHKSSHAPVASKKHASSELETKRKRK